MIVKRNEWGISLLNIQPSGHVLEIGFGPGVAIQKMCDLVTDGIIYGIDHDEAGFDSMCVGDE
jgi:fibrillarin-like rRNA methylase